jgi:hypothetical protein
MAGYAIDSAGNLTIDGVFVTAGTINSQTISSAANFTGTLAVASTVTGGTYNGVTIKNPSASRTSATGTITTVDTYVTPVFQIAANTLAAGDIFEIWVHGTCTTSVSNVVTFNIRLGTAGTTSDTSILLLNPTSDSAGTNVPFSIVTRFTVRTTGSSGTGIASTTLLNGTAGGIVATSVVGSGGAQVTINTTGALFFGLSGKTAAGTTSFIIQQATVSRVM